MHRASTSEVASSTLASLTSFRPKWPSDDGTALVMRLFIVGLSPTFGSIASVGVMANRHIRNVVFPVQVWAGAPNAAVAQLVVHFHGKEKVMGSFPIGGSNSERSAVW